VPVASAEGVVSVLISGVFNEGESNVAFVKTRDGWERRDVEVGINNLQFVEVKSGLADGEKVSLSRPPEFRRTND